MKIKKYYTLIGITVVMSAANILAFWFGKNNDLQMRWIGFVIVWLNLVLSWITFGRKKDVSYLFISGSVAILVFLLINNYWISTRVL